MILPDINQTLSNQFDLSPPIAIAWNTHYLPVGIMHNTLVWIWNHFCEIGSTTKLLGCAF